jgi:hypothetical protein
MINKVRLINDRQEFIDLPMDPTASSAEINLREIDGVGPVKADIASSRYALVPGEAFLSSHVGARNIVMTLGFAPAWGAGSTVAKLRQKMYEFAMTQMKVRLQFFTDDIEVVEISGVVEINEPKLFSADPDIVISIFCAAPYFKALAATTLNGVTNTPLTVNFKGNIPTGFIANLGIDGATQPVYVKRLGDAALPLIEVAYLKALLAGDQLYFSTVTGDKTVYVTRAGSTANGLGWLSSNGIDWPGLVRGDNQILITSNRSTTPYILVFTNRYGGL